MRGSVRSINQVFGMGAGENTVTMFRWDGCRWSADAQSDCDLPCTVASHGSATACGLLSSALGNALQIVDPPKQCQRASCQPVPECNVAMLMRGLSRRRHWVAYLKTLGISLRRAQHARSGCFAAPRHIQ